MGSVCEIWRCKRSALTGYDGNNAATFDHMKTVNVGNPKNPLDPAPETVLSLNMLGVEQTRLVNFNFVVITHFYYIILWISKIYRDS